MKKSFFCKIGFHRTFKDHVGENLGTKENPFYFFTTYNTCDKCGHSTVNY